MEKQIKVAIIQEKPVYLDLAASMKKAEGLLKEAAGKGAHLVVFGETWLCGYPAWIDYLPKIAMWGHAPTEEVYLRMLENGVEVSGKEIVQFREMAADFGVYIVLGMNERVVQGAGQGTLFNSFVIINDQGHIEVHHRKLMPTYTEKLLYGTGDGHGLRTVETPFGKMGALICWEHWMPLTRQALHLEGELLHIALWPAVKELHQLASKHYAFEAQAYVVAAGQVLQVKDLPKEFSLGDDLSSDLERYLLNGGSAVIAPDSSYLMEPQFDKEGVFIQELPPLKTALKGRLKLDVTGHYNRADVFKLEINKTRL